MGKIILIVVVFAAVYFIVRAYVRSVAAKPPPDAVRREEDMVRCRHCGVHLPRGESIGAGDSFYCSEEHRKRNGA